MKRKKKDQPLSKEISLSTPVSDLITRLMDETDVDEFNRIKSLFDLNMKKKEMLRVSKLSELQDKTIDEMSARMIQRPGEFNNKDLIEYFKATQDTISKADTNLNDIDISTIRVIQNQVNINIQKEDELPRESKEKVIEAIRAILAKPEPPKEVVEDVDFTEVEDSDNV